MTNTSANQDAVLRSFENMHSAVEDVIIDPDDRLTEALAALDQQEEIIKELRAEIETLSE